MSAEFWRPVLWPEGYEVSDHGRVRSLRFGEPRLKVPTPSPLNYQRVYLSYGGRRRRTAFVHTLVLEAFVCPRPDGTITRHLDGDPTNNALSNLTWGTWSENNYDQVEHGTHPHATKTHCPQGHAYDEANTYVHRGRRECRTCVNIRSAAYRRTEKYRIAEARRAAKKRSARKGAAA